jgi:hypothetical protein
MRRKTAFSTVGLLLSLFGLARASAGETASAAPAPLTVPAALGQDFGHGPTQMVTPADPYEAYWDPNDPPVCSPQRGRHRPVIVQASAELDAGVPQSVMTSPLAPSEPSSVSQLLHGKVVAVDANTRLTQMAFPLGHEPRVGEVVKIRHAFLLSPDEIGKLRIVRTGRGLALGRPIGKLRFCDPGDVVDYWSAVGQSGPPTIPPLATTNR